jgi:hypothetical protein
MAVKLRVAEAALVAEILRVTRNGRKSDAEYKRNDQRRCAN